MVGLGPTMGSLAAGGRWGEGGDPGCQSVPPWLLGLTMGTWQWRLVMALGWGRHVSS